MIGTARVLEPKVVPRPTVFRPKESNCNTDPIPTAVVPRPTVSDGLKYISLFFLNGYLVLNPGLIVNLLGSSDRIEPIVWIAPTVPSTALRTLNLELFVSTFKTFTLSVPIPKISFGTIFEPIRLEDTLKKVTNPVMFVFPTATPVVPIPTIENLSLETPIVYVPSIFDEVVEIPVILTISNDAKLCGVVDSTE